MFVFEGNGSNSYNMSALDDPNSPFFGLAKVNNYDKYIFYAVCSALLGLPSNILLLVILMRIGVFSRRHSSLALIPKKSTGSFERFLFEVVFIDTLLIIYDFLDNLLSYIQKDRSSGRHYLIHISDFCCKFFTYIAKMSVPLTTWLLLFLIINQLILTMESNTNNHRSFWNRGLYYVNAKYSTVFLIFIVSVYNIYPIEVLKYQNKEDVDDYQEDEGFVCSVKQEEQGKLLLRATNYGYNLLGISIPCIIILILSIIIIYRTCRNNRYMNKEGISLHYIAGTIGVIHALFNLPGRISDILMLSLTSYGTFSQHLIKFNHEVYSFVTLSYAYKCFICICISRRFRLHAKSVLCFLIENKYEDGHTVEFVNTTNDWHQLPKRKKPKRHYHHTNDSYLKKISLTKPTSKNISSLFLTKEQYPTSETTYWIRPYFTRNKRRHFLRPCGRSSSCHQISTTLPLTINGLPKTTSPDEFDRSSSPHIATDSSSSYVISVTLPNGESIHLPLPQKRAPRHRSSSASATLTKNRIDPSITRTLLENHVEKQSINKMSFLSSSHLY